MTIGRDNGIPKYVQLKEILLNDVKNSGYKAGDKYLTEKELMSKHGLSYATVTHAVRDLAADGYFIRKKSLGTFVTERAVGDGIERASHEEPLYINDISHLCSKEETPLSWRTFDQIQKGVINTYNGPIKIVPSKWILEAKEVNAVIIHPVDLDAALKAKCTSIIINLRHDVNLEVNAVSREVLGASTRVMMYLAGELGHRNIGFIGGNTLTHHAHHYAGYEIGLRTYQIPLDPDYVVRGLIGEESDGYDAMNQLLSLRVPPTAIFVDTSIKAFGALKAIKDAGLRIPEDVSVVAFGHVPEADDYDPPLTTVKVPNYEMGKRAVELLLRRIREKRDTPTEILSCELLRGGSCAKYSSWRGKDEKAS